MGAGAHSFPRLVHDLKTTHKVHVLIIIEPQISGQKADKVISKMGFNNSYRSEAEGFSGGIWLLWEYFQVNIDIINTSSQLIHCKVSLQEGKDNFFLTCVYGSPNPLVRQGLWSQLENIYNVIRSSKWTCMGDFNFYTVVDDKQGVLCQVLDS